MTLIYKCLWQKKKSTQQHPEIQLASSADIKIVTGTKLKYLSEQITEYGTNHMFQVLDETPLQKDNWIKRYEKTIWEYHGKYYLQINGVKVKEAKVENVMIFRKMESRLQVIVFLELLKPIYLFYIYIYTEWDYQNQL